MEEKTFKLRFPIDDIPSLAEKYEYRSRKPMEAIAQRTIKQGYMLPEDFRAMCAWKTPRSKSKTEKNTEGLIKEATACCLQSKEERLRLFCLLALEGVAYPTASTILHFCFPNQYPILDFRALWSLSITKPPVYTYSFWAFYVAFTRKLSANSGYSMDMIDRALWQYSKEKQNAAAHWRICLPLFIW